MATSGSTKSQFEIFYGEKPNIIGSLSEFGRITYVTKRNKTKKQITYKTHKASLDGYTDH